MILSEIERRQLDRQSWKYYQEKIEIKPIIEVPLIKFIMEKFIPRLLGELKYLFIYIYTKKYMDPNIDH